MKTSKTVFAIVGHPRTGTHFLASLLRSTGSVYQFDEVFFPAYRGFGSFFSFMRSEVEHDWGKMLITDLGVIDGLMERFFEDCAVAVEEDIVGFDLKIPHLNFFPNLYGALLRWDVKVIHLVRRSSAARIISEMIMNKRVGDGVQDIHYSLHEPTKVRLDPDTSIEWMLASEAGDAFVREVFQRQRSKYFEVAYEDLIGDLGPRVFGDLCEFLGFQSNQFAADTIRQQLAPISSAVENWDEFRAELSARGLTRLLGGIQLDV